MINSVKKVFSNYANFKGRATRKDFWLGWLGIIILFFIYAFIITLLFKSNSDIIEICFDLYVLALVVPMLSLEVRRLHDINKPGYYWFIRFIPIVGIVMIFIYLCTPSIDEDNNYYNDLEC